MINLNNFNQNYIKELLIQKMYYQKEFYNNNDFIHKYNDNHTLKDNIYLEKCKYDTNKSGVYNNSYSSYNSLKINLFFLFDDMYDKFFIENYQDREKMLNILSINKSVCYNQLSIFYKKKIFFQYKGAKYLHNNYNMNVSYNAYNLYISQNVIQHKNYYNSDINKNICENLNIYKIKNETKNDLDNKYKSKDNDKNKTENCNKSIYNNIYNEYNNDNNDNYNNNDNIVNCDNNLYGLNHNEELNEFN